MVVTELVKINNKEFKHTYSDKGFMIKRDNVLYDEAYDPVGFEDRTYNETDKAVGEEEEEVIQWLGMDKKCTFSTVIVSWQEKQ